MDKNVDKNYLDIKLKGNLLALKEGKWTFFIEASIGPVREVLQLEYPICENVGEVDQALRSEMIRVRKIVLEEGTIESLGN